MRYIYSMQRRHLTISPLLFPILFFALTILVGTLLLHLHVSSAQNTETGWIDALFTATSATCVTGLIVMDTGMHFSRFGQCVILGLIQVGGLGIMTLASLALYLLRQKVSLTDRVAVGENLLHDTSFHLGRFLIQITVTTLVIEAIGALLLSLSIQEEISFFSAVFHAVSAFCNAGFSLYSDSITRWQSDIPVNLIFAGLIILGGIGFSVMVDCEGWLAAKMIAGQRKKPYRLSWYSRVVLSTTVLLLAGGWAMLFGSEYFLSPIHHSLFATLVGSFFQSVTCRTAGFNSVDIGSMTNVSLLLMMFFMWIGAAPGSTGGGIKVTTLRVLVAYIIAQFRGRRQAVIGNIAPGKNTINRAIVLTLYSLALMAGASLLLLISEGAIAAGSRGPLLEISFEVVSAMATVGLSMGQTASFSAFGKCVLILLMFVGRLGPLIFLAVVQEYQREEVVYRPEGELLIG